MSSPPFPSLPTEAAPARGNTARGNAALEEGRPADAPPPLLRQPAGERPPARPPVQPVPPDVAPGFVDPALTGGPVPPPSASDKRRAMLRDVRAALADPALRAAYEAFVKAASDVAEAGLIFEMVERRGRPGEPPPALREPRALSIAVVPEPAIEPGFRIVVLMGVGFWEFLPGRFYGSERVLDGTRLAMDTGTYRFFENTASGDAEIVGHSEGRPLAQYLRVDIQGDGLSKSIAISNMALGGAFVAAYRNYVEVLAGCPYRSLHPYRQLAAPALQPEPGLQRATPAEVASQAAALPAASRAMPPAGLAAPLAAAGAARLGQPRPARPRRDGARSWRSRHWAWLALLPVILAAYGLGAMLGGGAPEAPSPAPREADRAPRLSDPPPTAAPPAPLAAQPSTTAPGLPPLAGTVDLPDGTAEGTDLPPPPPVAPPVPPRPEPQATIQPVEPDSGQLGGLWQEARVRQDANVRSQPLGGSPIVRALPTGTPVRIIETHQGWMRIALADGTVLGWIYGALLE